MLAFLRKLTMSNSISIVMTTYNGEHFIIDQLKSINNQTRKPDQVIIFDDCSTDSTVQKIHSFISENNLQNWILSVNEHNLGWMKNFYEASKMADGDIIFFSDQDDIWLPNKIDLLSKILIEKKAGCVYGESIIVDENNHEIASCNPKKHFSNGLTEEVFDHRFYAKTFLGCRMCVSRAILDYYLKIQVPENGHDSQCARIALLVSSLWRVDTPVIRYRMHKNNTSGVVAIGSFGYSNPQKRISAIKSSEKWLSRMAKASNVSEDRRQLCQQISQFQNLRYTYLTTNRIAFLKLFQKKKYYKDFTMMVGDYAYKHGLNKKFGNIRRTFARIK